MADKDVSKPAEPPKPVQIGGESLLDRILPHIKKVIIGVVVIAVVISGFLGLRACQEGKKERETKRLAAVMEIGKQPVATPGAPADPKNPGFADEKTRALRVLDEMLKQDTDLGGPAYRAGLLVDADKIDEAIAEYKKCTSGSNTSIDVVLCREGLAIAIETKASAEKDAAARQKGLEEALAAFVSMQPAEDGPRRAYALYHQARLQLQLGKRNEAKSLFEKAKELTPPKELADQIERRLANLGVS